MKTLNSEVINTFLTKYVIEIGDKNQVQANCAWLLYNYFNANCLAFESNSILNGYKLQILQIIRSND